MRFSLFSCLAGGSSLAAANSINATSPQDALSFAYLYGFPLYAFADVIKPLLEDENFTMPTNFIVPSPEMSQPGGDGVVRPNADTMYSLLFLDLSHADVVVTIPKMPEGRFWVFPLCSPYGDDLVNLGSLEASSPGDYLFTYDPNAYGLETETVPPGYAGVIKFPMPYGLSNLRILTDRTEEDLKIVKLLQSGFRAKEKPRQQVPVAPPLNLSMFVDPAYNPGDGVSYYEAVMNVAATLAPYSQPYVKEDRVWVAEKLRIAGFQNGKFVQPNETDLEAAVAQADKTRDAYINDPDVITQVGNEWYIINEGYIGMFRSQYEMRYHIGQIGYLALVPEQSVYPWRDVELNLQEGQSLLFTFPEKPRLKDTGFWSLTAYGPDQQFVDNELKRYSLGSMSNLTYPDGSLLEGGQGTEFNILLQATDIEPPSNWTNNWLPITPGGANISVTLRWYGAEEYMIDGSYIHPSVDFIDAIRS